MGFLGFSNGIRRRSIKKDESVFDEIDRGYKEPKESIQPSFSGGIVKKKVVNPLSMARERQREARLKYLESVSLGNKLEEKAHFRQYKKESTSIRNVQKAQDEQKKDSTGYKVKQGAGSVFNFAFTSRGRLANKPKRLKGRPARGIYKSPFGR